MKKTKKMPVEILAMGAVLTALVIILQYMGSFIKLGPFSISLVLIPIVIGTATCGKFIGAWLGFIFGVVVLISGDAAAFLAVNPIGTVITVLVKGAACGFLSGLAYDLCFKLSKGNRYLSTIIAAIVCPIVNTGVFLIGCVIFFLSTISEWAVAFGYGENVVEYMFLGLAGGNFVFEFIVNVVFSPIIVRILKAIKKG
jgi:uncharacterized membrane protein